MKKYLFYLSNLYAFSILRPVQDVIWQNGDDAAWFLAGDFSGYIKNNEKNLLNIKAVKAYNPDIVYAASNVVPDFFPGIKVQLFHGFNAQKRSDTRGHFRIRGFFDLYCTQGPSTTEPFKVLAEQKSSFGVQETGWPKMDPLFSGNDTGIPSENERPVILFTSTFTPSLSAAHQLFETIKAFSRQSKWQWIINFHPKMDDDVVEAFKSLSNENLQFIETDDIIPLFKKADIMLSDTSSVISEYLLTYNPVVTFRNNAPGPHLINVTDSEKIEAAIDYALTRPAAIIEAIKKYADNIHPYRDGQSSQRVLSATDTFIQSDYKALKRKPLNLVRRYKVRKKMHYYRLK